MTATPTPPLRSRPDWRPLRGQLTWGDWTVRVWSEPRLPGERSADPFLVFGAGDTLRLAVADPAATNHDLTAADVTWSGQIALGACRVHADLDDVMADAARRLCDPDRRPRLANPLTALAVADVDDTGSVTAAVAGDCEVWVRTSGAWRTLVTADRIVPAALAAFRAHPGATQNHPLHFAAHVDTLDDPRAWNRPPLGFEVPPRFARETADAVDEVIVTSDGAMLDAARCDTLTDWLETGIQGVAEAPHPSPHGDLAVLHAVRR